MRDVLQTFPQICLCNGNDISWPHNPVSVIGITCPQKKCLPVIILDTTEINRGEPSQGQAFAQTFTLNEIQNELSNANPTIRITSQGSTNALLQFNCETCDHKLAATD